MSTPPPSECPSPDRIEQLVAGELVDVDLRRHVDACDTCRHRAEQLRLNNETLREFAGRTGSDDRIYEAVAAPTVIAGYNILGELYRGGQGVVHKAYHQATKRHVAIKTLLPRAFVSGRQRHRFEREIEIIAKLRHPNIVTLYDSGVTSDGRHYFAMEYLRGLPLGEYVRRFVSESKASSSRESIRTILRLFLKTCAAVQYAHQHGVIHRDLKPGNILVDSDGEPHVLDFGLAKALGQDGPGGALLATQTGEFMGTFAYAAPEQVKGDPDQVDTRADVYSLGVILYELLTEATPYPVSGPLSDVIRHITESEPSRPSVHRPQIDGEIDTILLKALSKDRERRYQSVESLRDDLERHLAGEPIDARRDSTWYVLSKMVRRHKMGVTFGMALLLVLLGATGISTVQYLRAERARSDTAAVTDFLSGMISAADPVKRRGGEMTVTEMLDNASQQIESGIAGDPLVEARIRETIGGAYRELERFDAAERHLQRAFKIRDRVGGLQRRNTLQSMMDLAMLYRRQDRLEDAERLNRQVLALQERLFGQKDEDTLVTMSNLAVVLEVRDRVEEALPLQLRAFEGKKALLGPEDESTLESMGNLAKVYRKLKRYEESEKLSHRVLEVRRKVLGPDHPHTLIALNNLGALYSIQKRYTEAEPFLVEAVESNRRLHTEPHSNLATALKSLGIARRELGDLQSAHDLLRESVEVYTQVQGPDHHYVGNARSNLGGVLTLMGRFSEAESELLAAQRILNAKLEPKHGLVKENLGRIVALYDAWNEPERGEEFRKQLLALSAE